MGGDVYIVTSQYKTSCTTVNSHPHVHCIPQDGRTALYQASFNGHHKVVDLLTNAGAAVDVPEEVCMHVVINDTMECEYSLINIIFLTLLLQICCCMYPSNSRRKISIHNKDFIHQNVFPLHKDFCLYVESLS